jgi:16S rRNA (cytidine1402-2'-O)-methyltransferase
VLYLIPNLLGLTAPQRVLPNDTIEIARTVRHFAVETPKAARAFLKTLALPVALSELAIESIDNIPVITEWLRASVDVGVISDAGCPGIADPGATLVSLAHRMDARVIPLVGPSSILLGLMAAGFNGQGFTFHGYLPTDAPNRDRSLRSLDQSLRSTGATQLFIETPYRHAAIFDAIGRAVHPETFLCVAQNLSCEDERIACMPVRAWTPALRERFSSKAPSLFLLGVPAR